uniref:Helicase ATP-binding domain-containing protein n=1 Tax=Amphimedon queenslandica TaxID=400682 RepID=A0A1X7VMC2_AMPQE
MEAAVEASSLLGYFSLKEEQLYSIKAFMEGRDVFVILPTGFELLSKNVSAGYLDHESSPETMKNVTAGVYSILFMSPEQLVENWRCTFSSKVYKKRLIGLIIDEAHCVVKWQ